MAKHDPEHYEEMSKPFETREVAQKAVDAFIEAVGAARDEYGIANVLVSAQVFVEGETQIAANRAHYGDSRMAPIMAHSILAAKRREIADELAKFDASFAGITEAPSNDYS